ncbi:MAG TPA: hypothetical protein VFW16_01375, partial [Streptosporangiaceae bacterium]|nr:hypothetical protein [Streptosporangiaceae bacterium]
GPSYGFGYTPDKAWAYTSGRLYLSAVPGAVVLLAGLIIAVTRSRGFGGFCAFVAVLGGAWFIAGAAVLALLPGNQAASISTGSPLGTGAHVAILTNLALFTGVGALIVFFAAIALGRFSIAALRDYDNGLAEDVDVSSIAGVGGAYAGYQASQDVQQPYQQQYQYPTAATDPFPPEHYASPTEQYPAQQQQYQAQQQAPAGQYPQHDPFGLSQDATATQYPHSQSPFPPAPFPGYPDQPTTPETTATERPAAQDQGQ